MGDANLPGYQIEAAEVERLLSGTPYLVQTDPANLARFAKVNSSAGTVQKRAAAAARKIADDAAAILGPYEAAVRSDLVAESNRMEGYDWTPTQVRKMVETRNELLDSDLSSFVEYVRDDPRLLESIGLYRAYAMADEWAKCEKRPLEFELRSLHNLILASNPGAGKYKEAANKIGGSEHIPIPPWDVPMAMAELAEWFSEGTGDPVLDSAIVHAWLTHIHPFDDGNGRMARLLANLATVQAHYPPLLLRTGADRGQYLDALAASDDGDILPLYDLFAKSLKRTVGTMEKPGFVLGKVRNELLKTEAQRYAMWKELMRTLVGSLEIKARARKWSARLDGYPSLEDFSLLEDRNPDGNGWFLRFTPRHGQSQWMLWFGYRSEELRDIIGHQSRCWPSIFISRRTEAPDSVHPWETLFSASAEVGFDEITVVPARTKQVTIRSGYETEDLDLVDASTRIADAFCR